MTSGTGTGGPSALIGREVAGYRLERELGVGATGSVFLARRIADGTESSDAPTATAGASDRPDEVAIKILLDERMSDEDRETFRRRFQREIETLRGLDHPNIVKVLDAGVQDDLTYMVLPYMPGGTLAARIAQGPCSLADADRYTEQIASALDYAHTHGIIHRDIKPQNVLLDDQGKAYLSDFSIVRLLDATRTKLTSTRLIVGSPVYIAPEQIKNGAVTAASDIYSLGVVTFEMVTGRVPFEADSIPELLFKQSYESPPLPRSLRSDLPEPAEAVIWQALAKHPEERFASASAFAQAFDLGIHNQWDPSVRAVTLATQPVGGGQAGIPTFTNTAISQGTTWNSQASTQPSAQRSKKRLALIPPLVAVVVLIALTAAVLSRNGLFGGQAGAQTPGTQSPGISQQGGSTATSGHSKGATATVRKGGSGGGSTPSGGGSGSGGGSTGGTGGGTSGGGSGTGGGSTSPTATATARPTATRTATPRPAPTATHTPTPVPPPPTWAEQTHNGAQVFADPYNASGEHHSFGAGVWVTVSCRLYAPQIQSVNPDGYWYRLSSPYPGLYTPANSYYNGDPPGGPYTHNTDFNVAVC